MVICSSLLTPADRVHGSRTGVPVVASLRGRWTWHAAGQVERRSVPSQEPRQATVTIWASSSVPAPTLHPATSPGDAVDVPASLTRAPRRGMPAKAAEPLVANL